MKIANTKTKAVFTLASSCPKVVDVLWLQQLVLRSLCPHCILKGVHFRLDLA